MTFLDLQEATMDALNLSSTDARTRVKSHLNLRLREVQSSCNLAKTRRGLRTVTTASGSGTAVASGVSKVFGLYDDTVLKRPLQEISLNELFARATSDARVDTPTVYAVDLHTADDILLRFHPTPNAALALDADVLLEGTDLSADGDEPAIPDDFHDILIHGAIASEYAKKEQMRAAQMYEAKFEKRLKELRYFLVKSAYLTLKAKDRGAFGYAAKVWPYGIPS